VTAGTTSGSRESGPWTATSVAVVRAWEAPGTDASPPDGARRPSACGALDVERLQRAVRSGDRVCPASASCVLVAFGQGAAAVPPWVLAQRLAEAVLPDATGARHRRGVVDVTVGLAHVEPEAGTGVGDLPAVGDHPAVHRRSDGTATLVRSAADAEQAARRLLATAPAADGADDQSRAPDEARSSSAAIALDQLRPWAPPAPVGTTRRRGLVLRSLAGSRWPTATSTWAGRSPGTGGTHSTVAVVATGDGLGTQQLAARSAELATALGLPASSLGFDDELGERLSALRPGTVVVVLDDVPADPTWTSWSGSTWERSQRAVDAAVATGASVVAIGGCAGALAAAVERGAEPVFGPEDLRSHLEAVSSPPNRFAPVAGPAPAARPDHFDALLRLTTSERRVLYYLTAGWGATDVATELVVSLATVRTHIRAVLRKLNVRSQLAAVAIANAATVGAAGRAAGDRGRLGA
jgi:DNA-binding CsgD family transcriptional regulator